jgi:hypothetical protein
VPQPSQSRTTIVSGGRTPPLAARLRSRGRWLVLGVAIGGALLLLAGVLAWDAHQSALALMPDAGGQGIAPWKHPKEGAR